jgi:hypothetical protein
LANLNDSEDINRTWENIKKNMKIWAKDSPGLYIHKQHTPWFIFEEEKEGISES